MPSPREAEGQRESYTAREQGLGADRDPALTIPPNHLEVGVFLLDVVHHGDLIHGVPLGGVLRERGQESSGFSGRVLTGGRGS